MTVNLNAANDTLLAVRVEVRLYCEVRDLILSDAAAEAFRADMLATLVAGMASGLSPEAAVSHMRASSKAIRASYCTDPEILAARAAVARWKQEGILV